MPLHQLMRVYFVDTKIAKIQEFTKADTPLNLKPHGGGTRFDPAFDDIEASAEDPICLIYLTDMCCSRYPGYIPSYPVLWVNTNTKLHYGKPPFGELVYMNGNDDY
ncbi:MAG: VWA-like domain-containing protein [Desulfobacteraceae bacterium]